MQKYTMTATAGGAVGPLGALVRHRKCWATLTANYTGARDKVGELEIQVVDGTLPWFRGYFPPRPVTPAVSGSINFYLLDKPYVHAAACFILQPNIGMSSEFNMHVSYKGWRRFFLRGVTLRGDCLRLV